MKYKLESLFIYLLWIALFTIPVYLQLKHEEQQAKQEIVSKKLTQ